MNNYLFGIDIGGTTVKCGLFGLGGSLVDKWEIMTETLESFNVSIII